MPAVVSRSEAVCKEERVKRRMPTLDEADGAMVVGGGSFDSDAVEGIK